MARPDDPPTLQCFRPSFRALRAYALWPTAPLSLDQAVNNEVTLRVPWEEDLLPGPVGQYVEVVDVDPESECFYAPVDLNAPSILVSNGLPPSEGTPQFHQQTAYAWVMLTIRHFERGLGRNVLWSPHAVRHGDKPVRRVFVQRLRVYPHALRAANAYYSPSKKALIMGYFATDTAAGSSATIRATSFTCLSPAILAHETTHAILDGLSRTVGLAECGTDELAVQEAFADVIALFQQLAVPGYLRNWISVTSDLDENQRRMEEVARNLVQPVGIQAGLRKRIGAPGGQQAQPDLRIPKLQEQASLLVAAIFGAFAAVWRMRCARLFSLSELEVAGRRLTGSLQSAVLSEACKSAGHLLRMCIRAIDYCPPVDVTVKDFLRALVTADADMFPEDELRYRNIMVAAFRQFGLRAYPGRA